MNYCINTILFHYKTLLQANVIQRYLANSGFSVVFFFCNACLHPTQLFCKFDESCNWKL
jgi:hypothetical protein